MCGIIGINCNGNLKNTIDKSLKKLRHRGPDSNGFFISNENDTLIGHTRLAIIDLSANGNQPMLDTTNRFVISYNGEIYNFLDLKHYLNKNYGLIDWKTNTDTEVILQGFIKEKEKFFAKLNGIYSFIIYDKKTKYFHVLRDPIGIKPLYYTLQNDAFYCSSELRGLTCLSGLSKSLRVQSFADQIAHMYIPEPFTVYNEFFKLEPGLYQTYFKGKKIAHQKISYDYNKTKFNFSTEKNIVEEFRQKLNKAVKRQLISDVPISVLLSGGLDSSAITMLALKQNAPIKNVYTISYNENDMRFDEQGDDFKFANMLALKNNFKINVIRPKKNILSLLEEIPSFMDDGITDPASLNTYIICKNARENGIKVLLSGQGADEFLCGYRRYIAEKIFLSCPSLLVKLISKFENILPNRNFVIGNSYLRRIKRLSQLAKMSNSERLIEYFSWENEQTVKNLFNFKNKLKISEDLKNFFQNVEENNTLHSLLKADQKFDLLGLNLTYSDTMSMRSGVELRVPFLDLELVNFMEKIPLNLKIHGFKSKYILRKSMEGLLPKQIINRSKAGFGLPLRSWFRDNNDILKKYFDKRKIVKQGIFNYDMIKYILQSKNSENTNSAYTIFTLLCQQIWLENNKIL